MNELKLHEVSWLRQQAPKESLSSVSSSKRMRFVRRYLRYHHSRRIRFVRIESWDFAKLLVLQLLHFTLETRRGADVLEQRRLVVDPQFGFFQLAVFHVLLPVADFRVD